jgi:integration host factor subunit beta
MTKSDLIMCTKVKNAMPVEKAEEAVNIFFETLANGLKSGRRVELRGFGTFQVRDYDGYLGRNPRTGESVTIAPKRLPFFKPGKEAKKALNDGVTP